LEILKVVMSKTKKTGKKLFRPWVILGIFAALGGLITLPMLLSPPCAHKAMESEARMALIALSDLQSSYFHAKSKFAIDVRSVTSVEGKRGKLDANYFQDTSRYGYVINAHGSFSQQSAVPKRPQLKGYTALSRAMPNGKVETLLCVSHQYTQTIPTVPPGEMTCPKEFKSLEAPRSES
jgi:Type IV pilin-like G and H, putative